MSFRRTVDSFETILARSKLSGYFSFTVDCVFCIRLWFIKLNLKGEIPQVDFVRIIVSGLEFEIVDDFIFSVFPTIDVSEDLTDSLEGLNSIVVVLSKAGVQTYVKV